jgi:hypothetical protein
MKTFHPAMSSLLGSHQRRFSETAGGRSVPYVGRVAWTMGMDLRSALFIFG